MYIPRSWTVRNTS